MAPSLVVWHLLGFVAPAFGVAALTAALAKLVWRSDLHGVGWGRLTAVSATVGTLVLAAGLVGFGRDGKVATYAAMVIGCAVAQWWTGFGRRG